MAGRTAPPWTSAWCSSRCSSPTASTSSFPVTTTSTNGSRRRRGSTTSWRAPAGQLRKGDTNRSAMTAKAFDQDQSFMLVEIDGDQLSFQAISRTGLTVDSGNRSDRQVRAMSSPHGHASIAACPSSEFILNYLLALPARLPRRARLGQHASGQLLSIRTRPRLPGERHRHRLLLRADHQGSRRGHGARRRAPPVAPGRAARRRRHRRLRRGDRVLSAVSSMGGRTDAR